MRVAVVGDVMVDAYYHGLVNRISPEAPVPVVNVTRCDNRPGGAANVALNLQGLGATPVLCSVVGNDEKGALLLRLMSETNMPTLGIVQTNRRPTTVKTRIMSGGQHLLRVDEEVTHPLHDDDKLKLMEVFTSVLDSGIDVVIFEDYNKGVLDPWSIEQMIQVCQKRNIPTAVDPKKDNFFAYQGVSLFKPNLKELKEGVKADFDKSDTSALLTAVETMEKKLGNRISLVTLSELGVLVKNGRTHLVIPAHKREILDVSGAGDTVISVAALCLAAQTDEKTMAALANLAGGMVCEKSGVVPIDAHQLLTEAQNRL